MDSLKIFKRSLAFWSVFPAVALLAVDLHVVIGYVGGVQTLVTQLAFEAAFVEAGSSTFDLFSLVTAFLRERRKLDSHNCDCSSKLFEPDSKWIELLTQTCCTLGT